MTLLPEPARHELRLSAILHVLADPVRLRLLADLAQDHELDSERRCAVEEWSVTVHKSTLSHHFKLLREAGVTSTRVEGRRRWVRLRYDDLEARFPGLIPSILAALPGELEPTATRSGD
ncbi:DNA-binding transcriptional ArsR family regulator [Nocardiopsis mwathae]|uniref:DNA-binding transcriptional ArsR family regulator n=1 Tax=Nocardiopsis mwathae TaxID=1472723 RepID=A0A7W9YL82_9ACTN|nr:helix-turn-helix domain-containing protein [Nocardiopsis mwathae]MBB6174127.1 DNA-binding transcriptional ArsR family regulator [Nocardiopsis mwathae]